MDHVYGTTYISIYCLGVPSVTEEEPVPLRTAARDCSLERAIKYKSFTLHDVFHF